MKHYSAELENLNDVAAGANLEIKDGRARTATDLSTGTNADDVDGLVLSGNSHTHILDAQGSSFDPKTDTTVLDFIRTVGFSTSAGSEDLLLLDYTSGHSLAGTTADFTVDLAKYDSKVLAGVVSGTTLELYYTASTSGTADVTITGLPAGGGGGAGASTNDTNDISPAKTVHGGIDAFYDTILRTNYPASGVGSRQSVSGVATGDATGSTIAFTAASGLDVFNNNDIVYAYHAGDGASVDAFELRGTVQGTPTAGAISIVFSAANPALTAAAFLANWNLTRDPSANGATFLGASNTVTIEGNLTVSGTTTTINTATLDVEDRYITTANTDLSADKATMAGGIFVEAEITDTATTQEVRYAGIRYGNGGGTGSTDFGWEIAVDASADDGSNGTWQRIATGDSSVSKFAHSYAKAAATTFIAVPQSTHGLPAANTTTELYTVQVYEDGTGNWEQQIIPEQVIVATGAIAAGAAFTGSPAAVAGDVLVLFGATAATVNGRIVIIG